MISISHAFSIIKESGEAFTLSYVRANDTKNGPKGSIKTVKCLYGAPNPKTPGSGSLANGSSQSRKTNVHKLSGTIPLTALPGRNYITPLISHLVEINGQKIRH